MCRHGKKSKGLTDFATRFTAVSEYQDQPTNLLCSLDLADLAIDVGMRTASVKFPTAMLPWTGTAVLFRFENLGARRVTWANQEASRPLQSQRVLGLAFPLAAEPMVR